MTPPLVVARVRAPGARRAPHLLCADHRARGWPCPHAEDAKIAQIHTANIDPSLLHGGRQLPDHRFRHARVRRHEGRRRSTSGAQQSQTGQRSDTIMVAHIDPGKRTGVLVSFPRDLWVPIPGHGTAKINAAFAYGGAQLTIETIEQDFDVPISHYLEVDFAGFRNIVNAIGSVPIYFPTPARDTQQRSRDQHGRLPST